MNDHVELSEGIVVKPSNRMTGRVNIIGKGEEKLSGSITVKRFSELTAGMNVYSDEVILNPSYPPLVGNQRKATLLVPNRESLAASIGIPPKNKMYGMVEVLEPPTYYMELESEKDTFVRSSIPTLNYGEAQSMAVGYNRTEGDVFRSLIKFDIDQIPENADIKSVSLRLFNSQINSTTHQVGVYTASTDWLENGTTWVNQPAVKELVTIASLGEVGYTDIDVTNIVREWYSKSEDNHGFLLRAMSESSAQFEQFATREAAINNPYLDIEYKLDIIYSIGRSSIESNMFVYAYGESDLRGSINIPQFDDDRNMAGSIHILNLNLMLEANIKINKPDLYSIVTVRQTESQELNANISVRVKGGHLPSDRLTSRLTISTPDIRGTIRIRRPRRTEHRTLDSSLFINRQSVKSSIAVRRSDGGTLSGNLQVRYKNETAAEIKINKPNLMGSITVTYYESLPASINIRNVSSVTSRITIPHRRDLRGSMKIIHASHVPSSIQVISGYLRANIVVPYHGEDVMMGKMTVRVIGISEIHGTINVGGDNILGGYAYIF